jgi:aspartyl-tRNA(Asn)/glutamyl-tRNA(Gln) amidotransferase subunit A
VGHLPVGFQLMGPAFSESRLLSAAHALEGAIGFRSVPTFCDSRDSAIAPGGLCHQAAQEAQER